MRKEPTASRRRRVTPLAVVVVCSVVALLLMGPLRSRGPAATASTTANTTVRDDGPEQLPGPQRHTSTMQCRRAIMGERWLQCLRRRNGSDDGRPGGGACPSPTVTLRIACVGDSITFGNGTHSDRRRSERRANEGNYPLELGALLRRDDGWNAAKQDHGDPLVGVDVRNFGRSGRTATDVTNPSKMSYRRVSEFREAVAFQPHIVLIMLGTNDCKPKHWPGAAAFASALQWVAEQVAAPSLAAVVYVTPPPALSPLGAINGTCVGGEVAGAMRQLATSSDAACVTTTPLSGPAGAIHGGVRIVDMYTALLHEIEAADGPTVPPNVWQQRKKSRGEERRAPGVALLHDGIHPTREGHRRIAAVVADALTKAE